jgi:hypothetical protein
MDLYKRMDVVEELGKRLPMIEAKADTVSIQLFN